MQTHESEPVTDSSNSNGEDGTGCEQPCDMDCLKEMGKNLYQNFENILFQYVSYFKLLGNFKAFIALIDEIQVPRNITEALRDPNWKGAVLEEMKALRANDT